MDNNLNNGSGIPNVSDIKFDDTPAESFANLYGGSNNVQNVQPTPSVAPNPGVVPGVQPTQSVASNPGVVPGVQPTPSVASNPGTIIQPQGTDLSNVNIDANKMQSIEEQFSKTSQYNPEDIQKEMLSISSDNQSDKNKSGLAFVIVLFIILALVIAFLPQITKLIK